jgi:glycogen debranching enzyme
VLGLRRYWRGPTWINAAWLVWLGLLRLGYTVQAEELAVRLFRTVVSEGLREYYHPYSGEGMGAVDFGWSTLAMEMVDPDPRAARSYVADRPSNSPTAAA